MGVSMQIGAPMKDDVTEVARLFVWLVKTQRSSSAAAELVKEERATPPRPIRYENVSTFEEQHLQQHLFFHGDHIVSSSPYSPAG